MSLETIYRRDKCMADLIDQLDLYDEVDDLIQEALESVSDDTLCSNLFEHYEDKGSFSRHDLSLVEIGIEKVSVSTYEEIVGREFHLLGKFTSLLEAFSGLDENKEHHICTEDFLCKNFLVPHELIKYFKVENDLKYETEAVTTLCEYYHRFYKGDYQWSI